MSFLSSHVGCDESEEEFGDCLFNPDSNLNSDTKNQNKLVQHKRVCQTIVMMPPVPMKRTKHIGLNTEKSIDSVNHIKNSNNHIKNESFSVKNINKQCKNNNNTENNKKIEIAPIVTTKADLKIDPKIVSKPPLPPKPMHLISNNTNKSQTSATGAVQKMKRKVEEASNASLVQKLSAQAEQLRLEIAQLKAALQTEKNAVRGLRYFYIVLRLLSIIIMYFCFG